MAITFAQLEALYWISRLGSFREAARHLARTQPSISQRIHELEANVGERLFVRSRQKLRITPAGAKLVTYANKFLALSEDLKADVSQGKRSIKRIRLGAVDSVAIVCLPALLRRAKELLPDTHIEVVIDYTANLRSALNSRKLDIAFLVDPDERPFLASEFLCLINEVWLGTGSQSWETRIYSPSDLADESVFILPPPAVPKVHEWFVTRGIQPARVSVCNSLAITAHLIASGVGIGILPRGVVQPELEAGTLKIIQTSPRVIPSSLYLAYIDQRRFEFQKLLEAAREIVSESSYLL